ncbi:carboxylesterase family protein [Brevundimonas aurantiaca]|uniref:carboxylesterase family protein n=1 Tax=Brevundimonas aurantiaca TaxID=74316 RepID=UPI0021E5288E|nr:carboxylesterase family protein [Brevundimonas aurantiaca]
MADGDIAAFKNIPYAAPPVAEMRWRPPGTALRWEALLRRLDLWADLYPGHAAGRSRRRPSADERGLPEPERLAPS